MIKSTIKASTYRAIYRLLNRVSPLDFDCGKLCGSACCTVERTDDNLLGSPINSTYDLHGQIGTEMGIYLLPGEDKIHDRNDDWLMWTAEDASDYDFPDSWNGKVYFVQCDGPEHCRRDIRPMQCRTFPLAPHINRSGELTIVYNDMELPYRCPLIYDEMPLDDGFVQATFTVWKHLIRDPLIYDLVKQDSIARESAAEELRNKLRL